MKAQIMAIGNITPDSFYAGSRLLSEEGTKNSPAERIVQWAERALAEGADILDIGACSTRPGSTPVSEEEEWTRLEPALRAIRNACPEAQLSLDTFRPGIAGRAIDTFGAMIINDISGGCETMYNLVRRFNVPYVWTLRGNLKLPEQHPQMQDINLILDPGLGFTGTVDADYSCLRQINRLAAWKRPILVGLSRKSMLYKPFGLSPETVLTETQVLQFYALQQGATILRTHDVAPTARTIALWERTNPAP